jgi:RNA polymerase sigma-70 factor, ECF subfamily
LIGKEVETIEIIEQCKSGNPIAQSMLFNTHYRQMYNLSMRILSDHHDVEDVFVISFTKVFGNIHRFEYRGDQSLTRWIKTIVIHEAIRFLKAKNKIVFDEKWSESELLQVPDAEPDVNGFDVEEVYSIIGTMPEGYRIVFNLFALEGYSHFEISELLNITESTSKSQLRKARIHIIEKMKKRKQNGN